MGKAKVKFMLLNQISADGSYEKWYQDVITRFEKPEGIQELKGEIKARREEKAVKDGKREYRQAKSRLQMYWLNFYENELVTLLRSGLESVKQEGVDLYIIAMPEVQIHDYDFPVSGKPRERNYWNPLYEETVRTFLGCRNLNTGEGRVQQDMEGNPTQTLINLTEQEPQIIIFAGTVWWKMWEANYPKGVIYNSAPVFYQGKCCFMWDKQYWSHLDSIANENLVEQWMQKRIEQMQENRFHPELIPVEKNQGYSSRRNMEVCMDKITDEYMAAAPLGLTSRLTEFFNPYCCPLMALVLPTGATLIFSIDICKDAGSCPLEETGVKPLSQFFLERGAKICIANTDKQKYLQMVDTDRPDIQIVLASDMKSPGLCCKSYIGLCDAKHQCAAGNKEGAVLPQKPAGPEMSGMIVATEALVVTG